ncbi:MAG: hypothetical protein COX65_06955 [Elusimicrobia bacterium CG_4_10_14_0_2_um_filter_56_8]|nr:MAG: hypothetical protein AUJ51_03805 [Elusimicrobia bacterium CG1_02_56_21]PJA13528.1 MAG: hypothetical protein COX65_06955 [Elusimicrobia bacterium CG_4_10_14_0_2_um_filter_56_8]
MKLSKLLYLLLALAPLASGPVRAQYLEESAQEGSVFFDGGGRYARAASENPAPEDRAALLAELKKHITIDDHGNPAERAELNSMLAKLMESKTARELSVEFIREDAKIDLSFEEIPSTIIYTIDGKKTFGTSGGHTHTTENPPSVHMNKAYMEARKRGAPETLAHEMLGHALERKKAEKAGVEDMYLYDENEEANAGLIGWTVGAELGNKQDGGWGPIYVSNPADYHRRLKTNLPYYAGTLSTEEMEDPLSAYTKRLAEVEKLLLNIPIRQERYMILMKVSYHLPEPPHNLEDSAFLTVREGITASRNALPGTEHNLNNIKTYLNSLIKDYSGERSAAKKKDLADKSKSDYFKKKQETMDERRRQLTGLMLSNPGTNDDPPKRPGQFSWAQLQKMTDTHKMSATCRWQP